MPRFQPQAFSTADDPGDIVKDLLSHSPARFIRTPMTYRELHLLLPCHSLEDFPLHHEGADADGLLATWTALWHPALLASAGSGPKWRRADSPPDRLDGILILAPAVSAAQIPTDFAARAATEGAALLVGNQSREALLEQALAPLAPDALSLLDPEIALDFLALGYCYLQIALLTRQMRYSTNLDETRFFGQVVEAARAAIQGQHDVARELLVACFDLLSQERDHYYTVDAYLLDLTLLAPHTLGSLLAQQLVEPIPTNLILTSDLLTRMRTTAPASWEALQRGVSEGYVGLLGGEQEESRPTLESNEAVLEGLRRGLDEFERQLGTKPRVYARRRFGVSVLYPQLLHRAGYVGVIHATFSDGKYPEGSQVKIRWQGPDHSALDTVGRQPLDAARPETFLAMASKLGESMDVDHVATVCIAHWPGHASRWYNELRRVAKYGSMLGKFVTAEQYFKVTDYPSTSERFQADQYDSPYLAEAADRQSDPISTSVKAWRREAATRAGRTLEALAALVSNRLPAASSAVDEGASPSSPTSVSEDAGESAWLAERLAAAAAIVPVSPAASSPGYLIWNPATSVRRMGVELPGLSQLPAVTRPVYSASRGDASSCVVLDVPACGYVWVQAGESRSVRQAGPVLATSERLANEYIEVYVHPGTGALQSFRPAGTRDNLLSQQLAFRFPRPVHGPEGDTRYSLMAADSVAVTAANATMGEITSRGRLCDPHGEVLARFEQRLRIWRGCRVLQVSVELEPLVVPGDNPWDSYYACRFAWADETAKLWRGAPEVRERGEGRRMEAPLYLEVDLEDHRLALFAGGLPFHRRTDPRMLDSLLIVRGEDGRRFELGIGLDVKYPLQEAYAQLTPALVTPRTQGPPADRAQGWLMHVDSRNVVATAWTPHIRDGRLAGFRVRLLETSGRSVHTRVRAFRPLTQAQKLDFLGQSMGMCPVRDGAVEIDIGAHEWVELEARW
jgi:alpha-mannosidase